VAFVDFGEDAGKLFDPSFALDPKLHELRRDPPDLAGDPFRAPHPAAEIDVPANSCRQG
jgi:hypothetical protein